MRQNDKNKIRERTKSPVFESSVLYAFFCIINSQSKWPKISIYVEVFSVLVSVDYINLLAEPEAKKLLY